ncbi:MAG: putative transcriptional regulator [Halieaceae bacterium]|jgi:putative transcriptional regulator
MVTTAPQTQNFTNHFLIAMPSLQGGIFANSITYMCEHSSHGAMGIVVNHPMGLRVEEILDHLDIESHAAACADQVMAGGPVQIDRGFVLHRGASRVWEATITVCTEVFLTTSTDILAAIAIGEGPPDTLVALGYAGWGAGQLEEEMAANSWLSMPAESDIIFNTPIENRVTAAVAILGIDLNLLSMEAGHA